jgi:hypothetical protein
MVREAAEKAQAQHRLLNGEPAECRSADEASHWIAVYNELVAYKEALLRTSQRQMDGMTHKISREESAKVDHLLLSHQLSRYRTRLDFWLRRSNEIHFAVAPQAWDGQLFDSLSAPLSPPRAGFAGEENQT